MRLALAALALAALPAVALAETPPTWPVKLPSSGGEVIIPSQGFQNAYNDIKFAPARRVGDTLYVSGIIAGPREGEATDAAAFETQVRRAFQMLDRTLKASGVSFDDVAMINSFHVWDGPNFKGTRDDQIVVMNRIKGEFIKGPHPAWTAVGATGLLDPRGVVEIQLIAHVPTKG